MACRWMHSGQGSGRTPAIPMATTISSNLGFLVASLDVPEGAWCMDLMFLDTEARGRGCAVCGRGLWMTCVHGNCVCFGSAQMA